MVERTTFETFLILGLSSVFVVIILEYAVL